MSKRNIYIDNIDVELALEKYFSEISFDFKSEKISVLDSVGRVTYKAVYANYCSPTYAASAMDGIFLFSEKIKEATEVTPVYLNENDFKYVNTGNPLDLSLGDCVVMIEELIELEDGNFKIIKNAKPWQHIRPIGEDIVAGEMLIKSNHKILPQDLGALITGGIKEIEVYKKPMVAIIPTGDEVIDIFKEEFKEKSVIDCNSYIFSAQIKEWGGIPHIQEKLKDNYNEMKKKLKELSKNYDVLVVNAGSSAGSKDYTKNVIEEIGEVIIHGVAIKPGKPTILGKINGKPVIGIPGYPVSAYLAMDIFMKPLLEKMTNIFNVENFIEGKLGKSIVSSLKHKELVRVTLHKNKDEYIVMPLARGAGITTSLSKADGILEISKSVEGIGLGERVKVRLLKPLKEIDNNLVSIGSHDIVMDLIGDSIKLCSTHVGSFGGILAIKQRNTDIAPIHMLDEESGEYNISFIKKYFPSEDMMLVKGVERIQGLIVQKGNPLNLKEIKDILEKNIKFVNRQRGSGTRILLDYWLKDENLDYINLKGYDYEVATHLDVAMAIKNGTAEAGLGIMEAAKIADLDFIPLAKEEYDFLINPEIKNSEKIKEFIKFLKSDFLKKKIESLDGYSLNKPGEVIEIKCSR
ncbi:MAG: molybdopterin biosynthesis protein [Cetobacterium somerae]|uniref:molybdopterin biosynthesis protein n=1 Tax=Cetobacterium TaxID=180162 RepID=UPI00163C4830|nr:MULTISPECIES: molybdopterin biosynthesis protein [Cetobacterium]MBC2854320.1 molybdopterin biosynthesis protein [Cetobacterium sp. 2G large]MCQ9625978.1 molybdopterin biosynthesis protein [Cetobacterium somerae]